VGWGGGGGVEGEGAMGHCIVRYLYREKFIRTWYRFVYTNMTTDIPLLNFNNKQTLTFSPRLGPALHRKCRMHTSSPHIKQLKYAMSSPRERKGLAVHIPLTSRVVRLIRMYCLYCSQCCEARAVCLYIPQS